MAAGRSHHRSRSRTRRRRNRSHHQRRRQRIDQGHCWGANPTDGRVHHATTHSAAPHTAKRLNRHLAQPLPESTPPGDGNHSDAAQRFAERRGTTNTHRGTAAGSRATARNVASAHGRLQRDRNKAAPRPGKRRLHRRSGLPRHRLQRVATLDEDGGPEPGRADSIRCRHQHLRSAELLDRQR